MGVGRPPAARQVLGRSAGSHKVAGADGWAYGRIAAWLEGLLQAMCMCLALVERVGRWPHAGAQPRFPSPERGHPGPDPSFLCGRTGSGRASALRSCATGCARKACCRRRRSPRMSSAPQSAPSPWISATTSSPGSPAIGPSAPAIVEAVGRAARACIQECGARCWRCAGIPAGCGPTALRVPRMLRSAGWRRGVRRPRTGCPCS